MRLAGSRLAAEGGGWEVVLPRSCLDAIKDCNDLAAYRERDVQVDGREDCTGEAGENIMLAVELRIRRRVATARGTNGSRVSR